MLSCLFKVARPYHVILCNFRSLLYFIYIYVNSWYLNKPDEDWYWLVEISQPNSISRCLVSPRKSLLDCNVFNLIYFDWSRSFWIRRWARLIVHGFCSVFFFNLNSTFNLSINFFRFNSPPPPRNPSRVRQSNGRPLINTAYTYHCATVDTTQVFVEFLVALYYKDFNRLMGSIWCRTSHNPRCPQVGVLRSDKFHFYSFPIRKPITRNLPPRHLGFWLVL